MWYRNPIDTQSGIIWAPKIPFALSAAGKAHEAKRKRVEKWSRWGTWTGELFADVCGIAKRVVGTTADTGGKVERNAANVAQLV